MPQVGAAIASWVASATLAVTGSATVAAAAANAVAALTFAHGFVAAATAWATVASASSLALGRPKIGGPLGSQVDFKADPNAGIPYAVGETGIGGNIVFATTTEAKNQHLLYLTVFSGAGPIEGFTGFKANGVDVIFAAGNAVGFYHNFMVQTGQLGAQTPATFYPPATTLALLPEWTDAHKLTGYAAQWLVLEYDTKKYPTGTPKPLTILKGVKVYDPRLDDTYPGGAGPQRSGDETTWAYSDNPFLHALSWCIGRRSNGKRVLGVGAPIALIDVAAFVEGANVCDANGWSCGGLVYSTDDKWQALAAMLQAGGGWPTASGAKISCGVSAPKVSLATLTGADQSSGEVSITAVRPRRDRYNAVIPRYRSAEHDYQVVSAAKIGVAAYLTEDGGDEHTADPEYPLCQDVDQAAQLGTYAVANSREFGPIVIPCKPRWWGYRPNDCITVDEPEWGLNGQPCVILTRERDPMTGVVTLTLQSETAGKHDFALGKTGTPPATPSLTGVDGTEVPLPDVGTWTVAATYLANGDGVLPAFVVTGAVDVGLVSHVIVDVREVLDAGPPASYGPWQTTEFPADATSFVVSGLKPDTLYQVRVRYRNVRGVTDPDTGTDLGSHTTGGVEATKVGGFTAADILAAAEALAGAEELALSLSKNALLQSAIQDAIRRLGYTPDGLPVGPFAAAEKVRTDTNVEDLSLIGVRDGAGLAFNLSMTSLKIDGELLADHLDVLYTASSTSFAQIVAEQSARISADAAMTLSVNSLTSTVGSHTATLLTHAGTLATLDGRTEAFFEIVAAAGADPAYVKINASGYGSAIMFAAKEISLFNTASGSIVPALKLVSGEAYFANPVSVDVGSKRLTIGPGFGASGDLVMWFGADSVAIGSMTKTNGHFALATDGKVYHGTAELGSGGLTVTLNTTTAASSNPGAGAGTYTTNTVTATVTGAAGSVSYRWAASDGFTVTNPTGATTAFSKTLSASIDVEGVGTLIVDDGTEQRTLAVAIGIFNSP